MSALQPQADGRPSEQSIAFLEARARGGVGMIIVGGTVGTSRAYDEAPFKPLLRLDRDEYLPDLKRIADTIHHYNVPIIAQIMPSFGRMGVPAPGRDIISASPINVVIKEADFPKGLTVPGGRKTPVPREATIEEIKTYEAAMIDTGLRIHKAGWDGVEIPAHMSYFAASFLSTRTNWRTDEYGGSIENRARFLVNVVKGIRASAGPDFVIGLRTTVAEHVEGGQGPKDYVQIAKLVERAGADYVAMSDACYESMGVSTPMTDGTLIEHGEAQLFKAALSIPVLLQGFHDPSNATAAIEGGFGDAIMLGRPLLADPEYAAKVAGGRTDAIIHCDRNHLCLRRLVMNMPIRCTANPSTGRESRKGAIPSPKRVIIGSAERVVLGGLSSGFLMGIARWVLQRGQSSAH